MWEQLRQLARHSIIYGLGIMATQAVGFFLIPVYTRALTTADYGVYEIISRSLDVLAIILGAGLRLTAIRFYQDDADPRPKKPVISTAVLFLTPFSLAIVLALSVFAPTWSVLLFGDAGQTRVVRLALGLAFTELCFMIPASYIVARMQSLLFIVVSTGKFVLGILLNIYFVYFQRRGVEGVILANLINSALFSAVLMYTTLREVGLHFDKKRLGEMLRFGLPFVPGGIFLFILNNGDRFFLLHYGGQSAVGLYALGYKFGTLISMFVMAPFLQVWGAMMIPLAQKENAGEIYARVFTYMMFLYLWVGLGLSVFSPEAVRLATDPKFHSAHQIIPLVVLSYLFWSTTNLGDTPFYVKNRTAVKPFLLGAAAVVNLALYRWLIPAYGGWGAAWATLASFAFFAVLTRIVAQKIMPIPYDNRRFLTMLFVAGLLYAASRAISGSMLGLAGKVGLCLVFPLALYALGFFDLRERQKLQELYRQHVLRRQTGEPRVEDHPVERAD